MSFNTKTYYNSKAMVTFKEMCDKLYYTQHTFLSNIRYYSLVIIIIIFLEKWSKS